MNLANDCFNWISEQSKKLKFGERKREIELINLKKNEINMNHVNILHSTLLFLYILFLNR